MAAVDGWRGVLTSRRSEDAWNVNGPLRGAAPTSWVGHRALHLSNMGKNVPKISYVII